ncbi:MAG: hypothetical protein Q8927_20330, partial [Bacteroidota bacterium]|nr:hypothetical protein [Bacteroidota bacterium]
PITSQTSQSGKFFLNQAYKEHPGIRQCTEFFGKAKVSEFVKFKNFESFFFHSGESRTALAVWLAAASFPISSGSLPIRPTALRRQGTGDRARLPFRAKKRPHGGGLKKVAV